MPSIDQALSLTKGKGGVPREALVEYLESHPDEVFRPMDKEELASKINWPGKVSTIPGVLVELRRLGKIDSLVVGGYRFYGSHQAIELLKSRLPQVQSRRERLREARRREREERRTR